MRCVGLVYHVSRLHKNNTITNARETLVLRNFQTLYITKVSQLKHNVVIATSSNHLAIGEKQ